MKEADQIRKLMESLNEEAGEFDIEIDGQDVILFRGQRELAIMSKDEWIELANKFIRLHRVA